MKKDLVKSEKGVITVLVSLLLVGVLTLGTLAIEAGRYQAAKTQLIEANISAANSMIAAYDEELYARYGLLAIDNERFTLERATDYLRFNADQAVGYQGNRLSSLYTVDSVDLDKAFDFTHTAILKRQMLNKAKYINTNKYALNRDTVDAFFADFQNKCLYVAEQLAPVADGIAESGTLSDIPADVRNALTALYKTYFDAYTYYPAGVTLSDNTVKLLPRDFGMADVPHEMTDSILMQQAMSDVSWVLGDTDVLYRGYGENTDQGQVYVWTGCYYDLLYDLKDVSSDAEVTMHAKDLAGLVRVMAKDMNAAINVLMTEKEENLLLNTYIVEYFSNRHNRISDYAGPEVGVTINGNMENLTFATSCVEYIIGEDACESANESMAEHKLQAIRLISNLYALMTNSTCFDAYNAHSVAAHLAWANFESIIDAKLLSNYNIAVPFNKDRAILDIANAGGVAGAYASAQPDDALEPLKALGFHDGTTFVIPGSDLFNYTDSLAMAMWFENNAIKMFTVTHLIQLEMRYREQYVENKPATFMMENLSSYCRIQCVANFKPILPILSTNNLGAGRGIPMLSIRFAGY